MGRSLTLGVKSKQKALPVGGAFFVEQMVPACRNPIAEQKLSDLGTNPHQLGTTAASPN